MKRKSGKFTKIQCQSHKNYELYSEDEVFMHMALFCFKQDLSLIGPCFWNHTRHQSKEKQNCEKILKKTAP